MSARTARARACEITVCRDWVATERKIAAATIANPAEAITTKKFWYPILPRTTTTNGIAAAERVPILSFSRAVTGFSWQYRRRRMQDEMVNRCLRWLRRSASAKGSSINRTQRCLRDTTTAAKSLKGAGFQTVWTTCRRYRAGE